MKRTYRSREQAIIITSAAVVIPVVMGASVLFLYTTESWTFRVSELVVAAGIAWFGIFKAGRVRVCVDIEGIYVFNPLRRVFIPWERISGFSLRTRKFIFTPIGHANLKDGSSVPLYGIAAPNPGIRPNSRTAQQMIDELNQLLREQRAGNLPS